MPDTGRHTASTITDDALTALYERLDAAEASETQRQLAVARDALASATARAARAEAALDRVRALHQPLTRAGTTCCAHCSGWDGRFRCHGVVTPYPCPTLAALDPQQ